MHSQNLLWLALSAALLYAIASVLLKQALVRGCSIWQVNFFSNLCLAGLFQLFWFFAPSGPFIGHSGFPIWAGLASLAGQFFTFRALLHGDVSVATPLQGTKVIAVVFISTFLFHQSISYRWWWAAGLSSLGIFLVTGSQSISKDHLRFPIATVAYSLAAATCFALTDLLLVHAAKELGVARALATTAITVGLLTLFIYPLAFGNKILSSLTISKWLIIGSILLGLQSIGISLCVTLSGDATASNILYGSRCIWGVLLAWGTAYYLSAAESQLKISTMLLRILGAVFLFAAILMVLL